MEMVPIRPTETVPMGIRMLRPTAMRKVAAAAHATVSTTRKKKWNPRERFDLMSTLQTEVEKAFDYRGDVTLSLKDGRQMMGYVFNREPKGTKRCPEPFAEI